MPTIRLTHGRVDDEVHLRCRCAKCYSIVSINTHTGEATMIRCGAGSNYVCCHKMTSLDEIENKYYRGEFL